MARDFDGVDDQIDFGSDASLDNFSPLAWAGYIRLDAVNNVFDVIAQKIVGITGGWQLGYNTFDTPDNLKIQVGYSGMVGDPSTWSAAFTSGERHHVVITHDPSNVANNPTVYYDGVSQSVTQDASPGEPVGTYGADASVSMIAGQTASGGQDLDGAIGWFCYDNALWDVAAVNRARWWGRPHGGIKFYHPFVSDKLGNEGTATATGTASGTTVQPMAVPVVRPGTAMMGMIGW